MTRRHLTIVTLLILLFAAVPAGAQVRHEIQFPDLPGLVTLKCDFHMHSVFSDGTVWPTVRVDEAWRMGLDSIALTDHIEYQPHKDDVPTKHNRPYELAAGRARQHDLLLPRGTEITRETPPGHFNAIFLDDVDPLDTPDFVEAIKQANEQGAFVFWNHQAWKGEEAGSWLDVHTQLFDNKWFHGMEVANGDTYYPTAHRWCLEKGLTMIGNSDVHTPDLRERSATDDHRTMTLVFAKERSLESIQEALQEGRTAVWFKDQLIGRREIIAPMYEECVRVSLPHLKNRNTVWVKIRNVSDIDVVLRRAEAPGPLELTLPARTTSLMKISVEDSSLPIELKYVATNFLIGPEESLTVTMRLGE